MFISSELLSNIAIAIAIAIAIYFDCDSYLSGTIWTTKESVAIAS